MAFAGVLTRQEQKAYVRRRIEREDSEFSVALELSGHLQNAPVVDINPADLPLEAIRH